MRAGIVCLLGLLILLSAGSGLAAEKMFGKGVSMENAAMVSEINAKPADFNKQNVLVAGKVVSMCTHSGCWVMVETEDNAQILCRSLDESIHFTPDVMNQMIQVQGELMYDKDAPGMEMKAHEGEEPHACPNPQVMLSITGAVVNLVDAVPEAEPEAETKAE